MNLQEAKILVAENQHLIGKFNEEYEITNIIISPSDGNFISEISSRILRFRSYDDI